MGSAAEEQNKQIVRQFFEALNRQDTERIGQLVSSTNYSFHLSGVPPMDWKGDKQFIATINNAFPDLHNNM
jgi:ketosteroid isomerase-like protein